MFSQKISLVDPLSVNVIETENHVISHETQTQIVLSSLTTATTKNYIVPETQIQINPPSSYLYRDRKSCYRTYDCNQGHCFSLVVSLKSFCITLLYRRRTVLA